MESTLYNSLIYGISTGKTFYLYDKDTFPAEIFYVVQKCLHLRSGGDRIPGDDFPVDMPDRDVHAFADGVLCVGGHFARIPFGDYVDCEIMNGESGKKRNDLIVAKFSTTGSGGIDTMELNVIQGTSGESGTDPEVKSGNLYKEEKIREVPLYRVRIEGLNIIAVEPMFEIMPTNEELRKKLDELNSKCYKNISDGVEESVYRIGNEIHVIGTMVKQSGGDYIALFTEAQLRKWFGTDYDASRLNITTNNGDSATAATHLYAPEKWSDGAWYQYFYPRYVGPIRINYHITYKLKG